MKKIGAYFWESEKLAKRLESAQKLFWFLGIHVFFIILAFIFLDLIIGGFLLYKYGILPAYNEPSSAEKSFKFEDQSFRDILTEIQKREEKFNAPFAETYLDPFKTKEIKQ